jgi:protease-4
MNKLILLILAITLFSTAAQTQTNNLPVADTDGLLAARVNPAALSFGNADGLGFIQNFNENKFLRQYSIIANGKYLGYVFDRFEGINSHRVNLSVNPFRNFYLGGNLDWSDDDASKAASGVSALFRPWDFLSIASVNTFYNDDSDRNIYQQGIAIRPMVFFKKDYRYRLALTLDTYYTKQLNPDGKQTKFANPVFGVQMEPVDGLRLGVAYNSETENIMANIGFTPGDGFIGTLFGWNKDNNYSGGSDYIHFSAEKFKSFEWKSAQEKWYELKLDKPLVDKNKSIKIGPFLINTGRTVQLAALVQKLKLISEDESIDGVLVKADGFAANFANYLELETAFRELKASGKKLVFYYTHIGNVNYAFAASVADEIYLNPNGSVNVAGMTIQQPYIKALLDTLGVEIVNFRSHNYKTAGNLLSEDAMTDAEREVFNALLSSMMDEYKRMVVEGRGDKITIDFDDLINNGPYITPNLALETKLVDKLVYEDDLIEILQKEIGKVKLVKNYYDSNRRYDWSEEPSKKVALIYAQGNIHEGNSNPGESIGSSTFARAIKQAREDKSIDGIILRVNSGGGSAVASDIIANQIEKCSEGENKKPVIASFGGVAGSGGYYIAAHADHIVAQPVSLTGSIGVLGMVVNAQRMLEKIHINMDGVKKGKHADLGSWTRPVTEEEKEKIREAINWYYNRFTNVVAKGRDMQTNAVDKIAQGRIWTGKEALDAGLVDELGGMQETYQWMRETLGTGKLIVQEFDGQDEQAPFEIEADLDWVETEIPFIPGSLVEYYAEYRRLFGNSNEVAYFLTPLMINMTLD